MIMPVTPANVSASPCVAPSQQMAVYINAPHTPKPNTTTMPSAR